MFVVGMISAIIFVLAGSAVLSLSMETFDEVAEYFGIKEVEIYSAPIPDYELPRMEGNTVVNIGIGIVFTLVILGVTLGVGRALRLKK